MPLSVGPDSVSEGPVTTMRRNCKLFIFISCVWTLCVVVYLNTSKDVKVSTRECKSVIGLRQR